MWVWIQPTARYYCVCCGHIYWHTHTLIFSHLIKKEEKKYNGYTFFWTTTKLRSKNKNFCFPSIHYGSIHEHTMCEDRRNDEKKIHSPLNRCCCKTTTTSRNFLPFLSKPKVESFFCFFSTFSLWIFIKKKKILLSISFKSKFLTIGNLETNEKNVIIPETTNINE